MNCITCVQLCSASHRTDENSKHKWYVFQRKGPYIIDASVNLYLYFIFEQHLSMFHSIAIKKTFDGTVEFRLSFGCVLSVPIILSVSCLVSKQLKSIHSQASDRDTHTVVLLTQDWSLSDCFEFSLS